MAKDTQYTVVINGEGEPCIQTPAGRVLRIQERAFGEWKQSGMAKADAPHFAEGANLARQKNILETLRRVMTEDDIIVDPCDAT